MEHPVKISGYLEKKGSLKMLSSWKKYWFVLEGQLLLYYRSKDEYEGISPCKGSINLCPPCFIKPCSSEKCVFRIEKKTNSITLRAENRMEQDKWMQGLLIALKNNSSSQSRLSHYRFSSCEFGSLDHQKPLQRHKSMPARHNRNDAKSRQQFLERLREISARSSSIHMPKNKLVRRYGSGGQLYASIGGNSGDKQQQQDNSVDTFVVENDIYEAPERVMCRKLSVCYESVESERPDSCEMVENEQYQSVLRRRKSFPGSNGISDHEYSSLSPKNGADQNKNTIIIENDHYMSALLSENFGSSSMTEEAIYEEIDKIKEKLGFSENDCIYAEILENNSNVEETTGKSPFRTLLRSSKRKDGKRHSLKKRRSFFGKIVHRWKKRRRVEMDQQEIDRNVRILLELQEILMQRKTVLEQAVNAIEPEEDRDEENRTALQDDSIPSVEPALPPKTSIKHQSPYHDTPKNNNPIFLHNTQPLKENSESQKSIYEILDDLDKVEEEEELRPSVRKMIEHFSGRKEEEIVVLRRQKEEKPVLRHSDDLNELLEKLGKITVAPPMEPGVTSSLASPPISDDEWLKLLPIRKRRMSDPDYDIPRPHRSLILEPKTENPENVIPATRFFGPVLESSDFQEINKISRANSSPPYSSISPDSLEIIEKPTENPSYTSHIYVEESAKNYDQVVFVHSKWMPVEDDSITSCSEFFVDSLENNELSTAF